jgi:hypothetical protein
MIPRLDGPPCAGTECVQRQGIRMNVDAVVHQQRIVADLAKQINLIYSQPMTAPAVGSA